MAQNENIAASFIVADESMNFNVPFKRIKKKGKEKGKKLGNFIGIENRKILFWNVAGLYNKDRDFWEYLDGFDYICLIETWLEEKNWGKFCVNLSGRFHWEFYTAKRINRMGRAMGGMLIGIKKEWVSKNNYGCEYIKEGLIRTSITDKNREINIYSVYNTGDLKVILETLEKIKIEEEKIMIIGGDFNIRIGTLGVTNENIAERFTRNSKDKVVSNGGKFMVSIIEQKGWGILNGSTVGDAEGQYTYVGTRGHSVIDYAIINDEMWKYTEDFYVHERVESDHVPIIISAFRSSQGYRDENRKESLYREIISWSEEDATAYRAKTEELAINIDDFKIMNIEDNWGKIKEIVSGSMIRKKVKIKQWKIGDKKWWDKDCRKKKRKVVTALRKWKSGKLVKEGYINERREWRRLCSEKEQIFKEEEEAALRSVTKEVDVWKYLGRRRKGGTKLGNITLEQWKAHFMNLLEGSAVRQKGEPRVKESVESEHEKLTEIEIAKAFCKLRKKKAAGVDGIPYEAWINGGQNIRVALMDLMKRVWQGDGLPDEWKIGLIVPLYKKGDLNDTGNYRGLSLLPTAYKIYTELLRNRLETEIEEKNILPEGQAGFRKKRSTIDNIYVY